MYAKWSGNIQECYKDLWHLLIGINPISTVESSLFAAHVDLHHQLFGFLGFFMVWTVTSSMHTFSFSCTQIKHHVQPTNGDMLANGLYHDQHYSHQLWQNWHSGQLLDLGRNEHVGLPTSKADSIAFQAMNTTCASAPAAANMRPAAANMQGNSIVVQAPKTLVITVAKRR